MIRSSRSTLDRALCAAIAAGAALWITATPVSADSPAAISNSSGERARTQLRDFADQWIAKMRSVETQNRENPKIRPGASKNVTSYRGFGDNYSVEVRPTGHSSSPFIGILRYTEQVYTCRTSADCSVASASPVTEIFRYRDGRWVY